MEQKVGKNSFRHFTARFAGALQCSSQAGRKELASLRHLFASFRLPFRASAVHRLINVKIKTRIKNKAEFSNKT